MPCYTEAARDDQTPVESSQVKSRAQVTRRDRGRKRRGEKKEKIRKRRQGGKKGEERKKENEGKERSN